MVLLGIGEKKQDYSSTIQTQRISWVCRPMSSEMPRGSEEESQGTTKALHRWEKGSVLHWSSANVGSCLLPPLSLHHHQSFPEKDHCGLPKHKLLSKRG
jgi:hypothetical protein